MKTIKKYMLLFLVLALSTSVTMGQRPVNFSKMVTENIVESLDHNVEGVVEATIYNALFLSKYYPDAKIEKVLDKLNELAVESNNPTIRYKAQLAVLYITNFGSEELKLDNYKGDQSELFRDISQMLQTSLLVSNK